MFDDHYIDWRRTRIQKILSIFGAEFFKNKSMLELGCGYADIGNLFYNLGAKVDVSDGRQEHVNHVRSTFPHLNAQKFDANKELITKKYDVILHMGLLYHLDPFICDLRIHLANVVNHCGVLILETEVSDSTAATLLLATEKMEFDQSLTSHGQRPSARYIEEILKDLGCDCTMYKDADLNSGFHIYDWEEKNTKKWDHGLRRFWVVTKTK